MNNEFLPFRLLLELKTPVVLTEFSPRLDSIIFEALCQRFPDKDTPEILAELKKLIKFNDDLGVFHASSMRFGITAEQGLTAHEYCRTDSMQRKLSTELFTPKSKRGGKLSNVNLAGGPTLSRLTKRPSYSAPFAVFEATGGQEAIKEILEFWRLGVGYDAQNCGMGEFGDVTILELEQDVSITLDGMANRTIPYRADIKGNNRKSRLSPPYYSGENVNSLEPDLVRAIPVNTLLNQ